MRRVLTFIGGLFAGCAIAIPIAVVNRPPDQHQLHRARLADYCRLFSNGGELVGGAEGALSWRCTDNSDPAFFSSVGLYNLNAYCRDRYGNGWIATIRNLASNSGWSCATESVAAKEFTVALQLSGDFPPIGKRVRNGGDVAVVDSPNLYLDAQGTINLRAQSTNVRAFCAIDLDEPDSPPLMFGIIAPGGQRGFVRSDFTDHPHDKLGLPRCT
jgi:hypothetical protein